MNLAVLYIHRGNEDGFNMMKIIVIISMKKNKFYIAIIHCFTYLQNKSKGLASILREIRSTFCTEFKSRIKKKKKTEPKKTWSCSIVLDTDDTDKNNQSKPVYCYQLKFLFIVTRLIDINSILIGLILLFASILVAVFLTYSAYYWVTQHEKTLMIKMLENTNEAIKKIKQ